MNIPSGRHSKYPKVNRDIPQFPVKTVWQPEWDDYQSPAFLPVDDDEFADIEMMTAQEVLDWVGDSLTRRVYAVEAETAGRARKTLLGKLSKP